MFTAEIKYTSWISEAGYRWVGNVDEGARRTWDADGIPRFLHEFDGLRKLDVEDYLRKRTHVFDPIHRFERKRNLLTEAFDVKDSKQQRRYRPYEPLKDNPTLYREFAAIPWLDYDAVVRFASKYGMLESEPNLNIPAY
jgi:hypothetical protein